MTYMYYTYLHCKPDGTPFYVGKGSGRRARRLIVSDRNNHHQNIIKKYGQENILVYIFECESEEQALTDEIQQIAQLRREGYKLTNFNDGGEGNSGRKHSDETRKKMSIARQGRKPNLGRKFSIEARNNMGASRIGSKRSLETRAKMSEKLIGNKRGIGNKGISGRKLSDEIKMKISKSLKKAYAENIRSSNRTAA